MARRRYSMAIGVVLLASLVGWAMSADDVPYPDIPRGQGEACVEDTDFMRRDHMTILLHQRDDTVHMGVRSKQHSLTECINCHAVTGADSMPVTAASPEHFCRSCHDYAAVKIDCFDCHASRPTHESMAATGESR